MSPQLQFLVVGKRFLDGSVVKIGSLARGLGRHGTPSALNYARLFRASTRNTLCYFNFINSITLSFYEDLKERVQNTGYMNESLLPPPPYSDTPATQA